MAGIGETGQGMELIKYSLNGVELWRRAYMGPFLNRQAWATGVAIDSDDNVVMTGLGYGGLQQAQYAYYQTLKYSPSGVQLFSTAVNVPPSFIPPSLALAT